MNFVVATSSRSATLQNISKYVETINSQKILPTILYFVDDGKNPIGTKDILKKKLRQNIKLIFIKNHSHLGIVKSLNKILKKSMIPLIMRLDVDDTWHSSHTLRLINYYKRNKNSLIIAEKNKILNLRKYLHDKYFVFDNITIHSSWLINLNVNRSFRYKSLYPEDYSTISHYFRKGYKILVISNKSTNYVSNPFGFSKKKIANKDIKKIRKENFESYVNKFKEKKLTFKNVFEYFYIYILHLLNFFRK